MAYLARAYKPPHDKEKMLLDHSTKCQAGSRVLEMGYLKVQGIGKLNNLLIEEVALDLSDPMITGQKTLHTRQNVTIVKTVWQFTI